VANKAVIDLEKAVAMERLSAEIFTRGGEESYRGGHDLRKFGVAPYASKNLFLDGKFILSFVMATYNTVTPTNTWL